MKREKIVELLNRKYRDLEAISCKSQHTGMYKNNFTIYASGYILNLSDEIREIVIDKYNKEIKNLEQQLKEIL